MDTINTIELKDESVFPDETILQGILGKTYILYFTLLELYKNLQLDCEWHYYKDGKAWLGKVQYKKRTIVWMSAWKGYMQTTIYIPLKYIDDIYALNISDAQKNKIKTTKNIGKSKPCIFEIRSKKNLKDFKEVIKYKIENK